MPTLKIRTKLDGRLDGYKFIHETFTLQTSAARTQLISWHATWTWGLREQHSLHVPPALPHSFFDNYTSANCFTPSAFTHETLASRTVLTRSILTFHPCQTNFVTIWESPFTPKTPLKPSHPRISTSLPDCWHDCYSRAGIRAWSNIEEIHMES